MPVKEIFLANSSADAGQVDFACIRRRFRDSEGPISWCVYIQHTTSDLAHVDCCDEGTEEFWGTPQDWKVLNDEARSDEEFDEVAEYLRSSGQASA